MPIALIASERDAAAASSFNGLRSFNEAWTTAKRDSTTHNDIIFKGRATFYSLAKYRRCVTRAQTWSNVWNTFVREAWRSRADTICQRGSDHSDESGSIPTLPSSSSSDVCSPGEMVLGVEVPLQDPFTPVSCGNVIESGEHSWRHSPRTSPSCTCAEKRVQQEVLREIRRDDVCTCVFFLRAVFSKVYLKFSFFLHNRISQRERDWSEEIGGGNRSGCLRYTADSMKFHSRRGCYRASRGRRTEETGRGREEGRRN